jgi:hypothetical protein
MKRRAPRRLKWTAAIRSRGDDIFESVAKKLELKRKDVTFVGIHNRRSSDRLAIFAKNPNLGIFWKALKWKRLEKFRPFVIII